VSAAILLDTLRAWIDALDPLRLRPPQARLASRHAALREAAARVPGDEPLAAAIAAVQPVLAADSPTTRAGWTRLRRDLLAVWPEVAARAAEAGVELRPMRPSNAPRAALHVGGAGVALAIAELVPPPWLPAAGLGAGAVALSVELGRRRFPGVQRAVMGLLGKAAHPHERRSVTGSAWFCAALALLSLLREPFVGAAALVVLGLGDPAAGVVGRRFGRRRLANGRSAEGTATYAIVGGAAAWAVLTALHPELPHPLRVAAAAGVAGALAELLSTRLDDNLTAPVAAGLAAWAAAQLP
jgi:dolichol kinase